MTDRESAELYAAHSAQQKMLDQITRQHYAAKAEGKTYNPAFTYNGEVIGYLHGPPSLYGSLGQLSAAKPSVPYTWIYDEIDCSQEPSEVKTSFNKRMEFLGHIDKLLAFMQADDEVDCAPPCAHCQGSREGQRWNSDTRMMETVEGGCSYCGEK